VHCIVELIEQPAFVVSLVDIEIVNLERVGFGLKNFDLAIVFKDFTREVHRIDAIPADKVEQVKEWLTSMNIKYYESKMNLVWKPILKTILADPEAFVEEGGWEFLNMEASDSEGEDEEESQGFEPDSSDMDSEESSSDDDESDFDEEEEDSEDEEDELEESGKDWDELEAEALESDKKRAREGDLSDDERRRKVKGGPRRRR
jgi:nucleosome binding factor SPN SPT16 subunit